MVKIHGYRSSLAPVRLISECRHGIRDAAPKAQRQKHTVARLEIVMRTYLLKTAHRRGQRPISDPDLNGSYRVNYGLNWCVASLQVNELGSTDRHRKFLDMVTGRSLLPI